MKTVTMKAVPAAQSHFRNMNQSSPRPPTPTRKNSDHLSLSLLSVDASCSPSGHSSSSNNNNNHSSTSSPLIATSDLFFATSQTNNTNIKVTTNDQATRPVSPSFLSTPPSSSTSSTPSIFERCQTPMPSRISSLPQPPSSLSTARRSSLANESPVGGVGGGGHDGQGQAQGRSSPWKNGWRQDVISNHFESALAGGSVPMIPLAQHSHELSDQQIFQASRSGAADDEATSGELAQPHQGVIMAYAGPGASFSLGTGMASNNDEGASSSTGPRVSDWSWVRLTHFMRPLVSQSLVSRLYSRRPQFSNMGSSSWSIVRILNACHLLYLIPVTTITIARLMSTEMICDEQLFSWLTVQSVLFVGQIISACCILQRQTMSTRNTLLDQRSKVLLLVFMLWTIIGVGFLGADNNTQESSCVASEDPVYNLAFKIIVFHVSVIGLYFLPCGSFLLTRFLPNSVTSGMTRTATKPMIDNLGSMLMTEGMFGGDPEEATCAICLGDYRTDETIRFLPCQHHFHLECVDQWLMTDKSCPLCKHDIDKPMDDNRLATQRCFGMNANGSSSTTATAHNRSKDEPGCSTHVGFQIIII